MNKITKRSLFAAPLLAALGIYDTSNAIENTQNGNCAPNEKFNYKIPVEHGVFNSSVNSLKQYKAPDWFRDAKFGIWAHWGPQAVPRAGDWYARQMYIPGHPHYEHHLKKYGHPTEKGYKDIIPLWTAEKFNPDALMDKYSAAGAKYFVSMGIHHDNFALWNSKIHRWNANKLGPKRDIVGEWKQAASKRGIRFGVSEHLGASYNWWHTSHQYDLFWPKIGIEYDGANPENADLYHNNKDEPYRGNSESWYTKNPKFHQIWYDRIKELVDNYQPDLLYSDGGIPFGEVGRSLVAHLYNKSLNNKGMPQAVYNSKDLGSGEFYKESCVQDVERGVMKDINPLPWQTDTSNGDWFYSDGYKYKTTSEVIYMLADIVSKNGNLLLNVVLYPDGSLPPESETLLAELSEWMKINAEAIHNTRPWIKFGEGPTITSDGAFKENASYTAEDIRFTTNKDFLYAITLGEPKSQVRIKSLGLGQNNKKIKKIQILGLPNSLKFTQTHENLIINLPDLLPSSFSNSFKIQFSA